MPNTYNYALSDFFDYVSLSAKEGVDYFIDEKTLFVNNSSFWYPNVSTVVTDTKALCSLNLSNFANVSSIQTFDPVLSALSLPYNTKVNRISAGLLNVTSLSITGSNFDYIMLFACPRLSSINLQNTINIQTLVLAYNGALSGIIFYPYNFSTENIVRNINISGSILTDVSCDSLWTSLCTCFTGSNYSNTTINFTNAVTGLASTIFTIVSSKCPNIAISL